MKRWTFTIALGLKVFTLAIALADEDPLKIASLPDSSNRADQIVDPIKYITLEGMQVAGLEKAELASPPWSGWYFPLNEGGLANRYADPNFPQTGPWSTFEAYILKTLGQGPLENLSPSEKYDYLLGDSQFTLTRKMIETASTHQTHGTIEGWMGYCTGWANAAMMLPRPIHSVKVLGRDGQKPLLFRPSDIKALGALLWANGTFPTKLVGTQCQESPVKRDPLNDRPFDSSCRDVHPATWHLVTVNQLGANHRSFLIDSDPGFQIWNQPVSSYSYTYFHPITGKTGSLQTSKILLSEFQKDLFAPYRAPQTRFVVGIEMTLTFIYEKRPDLKDTDSRDTDVVRTPIYKYDLELDETGKIIGGEWWSRIHPDVLWVSLAGSIPSTVGDTQLQGDSSSWVSGQPLPESWVRAAIQSETCSQPLTRIVYQLFNMSSSTHL